MGLVLVIASSPSTSTVHSPILASSPIIPRPYGTKGCMYVLSKALRKQRVAFRGEHLCVMLHLCDQSI